MSVHLVSPVCDCEPEDEFKSLSHDSHADRMLPTLCYIKVCSPNVCSQKQISVEHFFR